MNRPLLLASVSLAVLCAFSAIPAAATPQLFSESKKEGLPAQNCQYCHVSKLPKKDSFKPDDLNDRGKWLMTEKDKQKAKDVKADWLKGFPGGKEQK
jgi:hypothetical protein